MPLNFNDTPWLLNRHKQLPWQTGVYIGRGTPWGNPFKVGDAHPILGVIADRQMAVDAHERYLLETPGLLQVAKKQLWGRNLICSCAPLSCHGMNFFKHLYELHSQQELLDRKKSLEGKARTCPACGDNQTALIDWIRVPAKWQCKNCKNQKGKKTSFYYEPGQTVAPEITDYIHTVAWCNYDNLNIEMSRRYKLLLDKGLRPDGTARVLVSYVTDARDLNNKVMCDLVF